MKFFRYSTILALSAALIGTTLAMQPAHAEGRRLVIGKISERAAKQLPRLEAMAGALSVALKPHGIDGVDVRVVATLDDAEGALRNGSIDMLSETVFGALALESAGVGEIAMAEWKKGVHQYHTVFFAKKGAAQGLDALRGRTLAFQDPGSTSGHHLPRHMLEQQGFTLIKEDEPASSDAVRYMFAGESEINVVVSVARGLAYAGTLSNLDWEDEENVPPALKDKLAIIHETPPVLRSVTVVRTALEPDIKHKLVDVLEAIGDDPAAQDTLKKYFKITKFQRIGPEEEALLADARALHDRSS